ncbi:MAG: hypothetical protein PHY80_01285 [Rickettsiales bacterium]|nr:hypothetical protein [Rickettsiales bacterium]
MLSFVIIDFSLTILSILTIWWFAIGRDIANKRRLIKEIKEENRPIVND